MEDFKADSKVAVCGVCCEIFSSQEELDKHDCRESVDQDTSDEEEGGEATDPTSYTTGSSGMFHCVRCDYTFQSQITYLEHACGKRKPKRSFNCGMCGKSFEKACVLQAHMKIHYASKDFVCEICSKSFLFKHHLRVHEVVHSNERPYKCDECGMKFKRNSHLMRHNFVHTGEKTYSCDRCDYMGVSTYAVRRHQVNVHTAERPFQCSQCPYAFSEKYKLNSHVKKTHESEKTRKRPKEMLKCLYCDKTFFWRKHFSAHLQYDHMEEYKRTIIKTEKPEGQESNGVDPDFNPGINVAEGTGNECSSTRAAGKCLFCDKTFSRTTGLIRHMKVNHSQEYKQSKLNNPENETVDST